METKDNWLKEYNEFSNINVDSIEVPARLLDEVRKRIFPSPWFVFGKMTAIHAVVGVLSLAVCNQFELNPFHTQQSVSNWFMSIGGHSFCMFLCGTFFMATTYWLSNFFLSLEEIETIRRREWLLTGTFGLISLAAFYFFGAELVATFVALWLTGAFLGGLLSIEGSYRLRKLLA